ncbi:hypothetical protein [[Phormidium] sp. ETS-05]|uniref:hypothetical protein n=1 Tax=[Phormidium] sp. ETS-05 TaxID=222819 RepID=UPI0018EF1019|nr:hypothetical protein [[Phormidium] sp. ETS-05]
MSLPSASGKGDWGGWDSSGEQWWWQLAGLGYTTPILGNQLDYSIRNILTFSQQLCYDGIIDFIVIVSPASGATHLN